VDRLVTTILRLEGLVAFLVSLIVYGYASGDWLLLIPLLILPDLSILGYLRGPRVGAVLYNAVHNWAIAGIFVGAWLLTGQPALLIVGIALTAHVGADRLLGYGLKYPTSFQETHLGWIGRRRDVRRGVEPT
jgi:hypothetical protein